MNTRHMGFALVALVALGWIAPGLAHASGGRTRIAITVNSDDAFVQTYLSEILARVLAAHRFEVVAPVVTRAELAETGRSPMACLDDDRCARSVAEALDVSTVIAAQAATDGDGFTLETRVVRVTALQVERQPPISARGTESETADRILETATAVAQADPPCRVILDAAPRGVSVHVEGNRIAHFPMFLSPGSYAIEVRAAERSSHHGELECASGHTYRLRVR